MSTSDWRWEVQIRGTLSDLEHLARHFTLAHVTVFRNEQDDSYLYHSKAFDACETSEKVLAIADDDFAVLSGILKFVRDSREPVLTGAVHKRHADGRRDVFVHIREGIQLRAELGEMTVTVTDAQGNHVHQPTPPPRTVTISALATQDVAVTKAMRLFAAPEVRTWVGLYRLHEVIEADVGGEHSLQKKNWGPTHDLKRFKHSANSVKVAGDAARHGKEHDQSPPNPMTIEEAVAYANYVLHAWLASKGA
jgi:hypothetical protein